MGTLVNARLAPKFIFSSTIEGGLSSIKPTTENGIQSQSGGRTGLNTSDVVELATQIAQRPTMQSATLFGMAAYFDNHAKCVGLRLKLTMTITANRFKSDGYALNTI